VRRERRRLMRCARFSICCLALFSIVAMAQTTNLITGVFLCQVQAQSPKPLLRGKALDPAGAPIAGAGVTAVPEGRGVESSTVSDQSGEFSLSLEPGAYTIKINAQGFLEVPRKVSIKDTGPEFLEVTLQIATQRDSVVVTDSNTYQAPLITSGTKTLTQLRDVPHSITVLTPHQIKYQQLFSIIP